MTASVMLQFSGLNCFDVWVHSSSSSVTFESSSYLEDQSTAIAVLAKEKKKSQGLPVCGFFVCSVLDLLVPNSAPLPKDYFPYDFCLSLDYWIHLFKCDTWFQRCFWIEKSASQYYRYVSKTLKDIISFLSGCYGIRPDLVNESWSCSRCSANAWAAVSVYSSGNKRKLTVGIN